MDGRASNFGCLKCSTHETNHNTMLGESSVSPSVRGLTARQHESVLEDSQTASSIFHLILALHTNGIQQGCSINNKIVAWLTRYK